MVASMVILVHNVTPHHHFKQTNFFDDHHDDDDDHGQSDYLGTHYMNNFFTDQSDFPSYKVFRSVEIVLPQQFHLLTLASADDYQMAINESPPLFYLIPSLSYRGPPVC
jgi:hypothetical protein